jgi:hypothetical protein
MTCHCRLPLAGHPTCDACGILVGDGHWERELRPLNNHRVCQACLAFATRRRLRFRGLSRGRKGGG